MNIYDKITSTPIILYGAGTFGISIAESLIGLNISPAYFCDKNKTGVEPQTGLPIISPQELCNHTNMIIIITSENFYDEIYDDLKMLNVDMLKVLSYNDVIISIPDAVYLKSVFKCKLGYELDLENPKTFNEKLNWLKLYDRNPQYTKMADKYEARKFVSDRIGDEYIVPLIGVWNNFDEINFNSFPEQFVLKCNHDSGSVLICNDKQNFNIANAGVKFKQKLSSSWFWHSREWVYKDIKPRILAQKYLGENINDYKILTFNGEPKIIQVVYDLFTNQKRNLYTTDWKYISASQHFPTDPNHIIEKPVNLDKMLELCYVLAKNIPHVRVDFWEVDSKLYFSEFTFYSDAGFSKFEPYDYDELLGSWISLPDIITYS